MTEPCISASRAQFSQKEHKLPLQTMISKDERYAPQSTKEDSASNDDDEMSDGNSGADTAEKSSRASSASKAITSEAPAAAITPSSSPPQATLPIAGAAVPIDGIREKQHTLLQFLGELMATGKLDGSRFSSWAPSLARIDSAPKIQQLYTLFEVFRTNPEFWIKSASAIIEGTGEATTVEPT